MKYEEFLARVIDLGLNRVDARNISTDRGMWEEGGKAGLEACKGKYAEELWQVVMVERSEKPDAYKQGFAYWVGWVRRVVETVGVDPNDWSVWLPDQTLAAQDAFQVLHELRMEHKKEGR